MGSKRPEWLPVGWKETLKVRSSGKKDKYYINPDGLKFSSKPEVLRYLKNSGKDQKLQKLNNVKTHKTAVKIKKTELPAGWIKEIRKTKNGGKIRRDTYYIDPITGRQFRSMREVLRYLESMESGNVESKPDDRSHIGVGLGDHSESLSTEPERGRLTDKKTYTRSVKAGSKHASGLKGAAASNKNMVENLLVQSEEDDPLLCELSDKLQLAKRMAQKTNRRRKIKKLANKKIDRSADGDQGLKSDFKIAELNAVHVHEANLVEQREREDDSMAGNLPSKLRLVDGNKEREGGRRQSRRVADRKLNNNVPNNQFLPSEPDIAALNDADVPKADCVEQREREDGPPAANLPSKLRQQNGEERHEGGGWQDKSFAVGKLKDNVTNDQSMQSGSESAAVKNVNTLETNCLKQREEENKSVAESLQHDKPPKQYKRKKPSSKWTSDLPRRTSKRLAYVEANPPLVVETSIVGRAAARPSGDAEVNTIKNVGEARLSDEPDFYVTKSNGRANCTTESPDDNKPKQPVLGDLSYPEVHKVVDVDNKEDENCEKNLGPSVDDILMDPCIDFAVKTLTDAIPIEEVKKVVDNQISASSSALPSVDIWADPCFKFAVKMLTSDEIPTENCPRFESSFQGIPSSSGSSGCINSLTLPKFQSDNFYRLAGSFNPVDAVSSPCVQHQGARDLPLPRSVNSGRGGISRAVDGGDGVTLSWKVL